MGVELGIKPWGVSTESPLPMGVREGLKVGLSRAGRWLTPAKVNTQALGGGGGYLSS